MMASEGGQRTKDEPVSGIDDISPDLMIGLKNPGQPRSKFSPYTKSERTTRRNEVYRLHFEQGISARKIAALMNVDKSTINADIKVLYRQVNRHQESQNFMYFYDRQMTRLATLRDELVSYRDSAKDIDQKRAIIGQLADLDFRMLSAAQKVEYSMFNQWHRIAEQVNEIAEKRKLNYRMSGIFEVQRVSVENAHRIIDIIRKEKRGLKEDD